MQTFQFSVINETDANDVMMRVAALQGVKSVNRVRGASPSAYEVTPRKRVSMSALQEEVRGIEGVDAASVQ